MKVREALHKRASISDAKRDHAANSKSRMKTDEQRVQDIANCLLEWESNPWDKSNISLCSLEPGFLASKELVKDFSTANIGIILVLYKFYNLCIYICKLSLTF